MNRIIDLNRARKDLLQCIKSDKKNFKNISVYYEILSREHCITQGLDPNELNINCIDGTESFNAMKRMRETHGYSHGNATDVKIEGLKLKRIIISGPSGQNYGDWFGILSGYVQRENELVCYMVRH